MKINLQSRRLILQFMRITLIQIVLSVSFLSISIANDAYSQELGDKRISIRISEQTLKNAIRELEQVSNARFIYSNTVIGTDNKVSKWTSG